MKNLFSLLFIALILTVACKKESAIKEINYPKNGLVSYFRFDDNLKDAIGNTPDGVNNGGTFITGKIGKAFFVNGIDQFAEFNRKTFKSGNNISVAYWFKKTTIDELFFIESSDFATSFKDGLSGTTAGFVISIPTTNTARGNFTPDLWTHFVGTYDGSEIKVYINGILQETVNHVGNISDQNATLKIGKWGLASYCSGVIDEFFIYNKTLSQAEVSQLYSAY